MAKHSFESATLAINDGWVDTSTLWTGFDPAANNVAIFVIDGQVEFAVNDTVPADADRFHRVYASGVFPSDAQEKIWARAHLMGAELSATQA